MSPRIVAALAITGLLLTSLVLSASILVFRPQPTVFADLRMLGLRERGEVVRDAYGVPHVRARNAHDLFYLQGYTVAQDRFFQMDLYRRIGHGRLSEVLGEPTIDADKLMRTVGLRRAAEADERLLSDEARLAAEAFAAGVNKFIEQHGESLPMEFTILGYRPEPWTVLDSLVIAKVQSYELAVDLRTELLRLGVAQRLGPEALPVLFPDPDGVARDDSAAWSRIASLVSPGIAQPGREALLPILGDAGEGLGSNCWALAGNRTESGRPLLAGDVHLAVRNPSTWYEVGLEGAGYAVKGFSIPGVPGVLVGHNERIAWSLTLGYIDTQDLYVERPDPLDLRRFVYQGTSELPTVYREKILVKGRPEPEQHDVVVTRHGPIITSTLEGQTAQLALRWTALDGGRALDAILSLNRASDWASFRSAIGNLDAPALNICYADTAGHIGHALAGRIPIRAAPGDGRLPMPGWTGEHEWRGTLPPEQNPAVLDPADGLVVIANQRSTQDRSNPGYEGEWDSGFRADRIRALLTGLTEASVEDLRAIQNDQFTAPSGRLSPVLVDARTAFPGADAQRLVREWDGVAGADSAATAVYEAWLVRMMAQTFKDKLGDELYLEYLDHARFAVPALHALVARPADQWFTPVGPDQPGRDALASIALKEALDLLSQRLGPDQAKWRWGDLHQITFEHPLSSGIPFGLLNIGPIPHGGDGYTVNQAAYHLDEPFKLRNHASLRMIVDLGDLEASRAVLPTGQSGLPFSRFWGDQTKLWSSGQLRPMPFKIVEPLGGRLILRPR